MIESGETGGGLGQNQKDLDTGLPIRFVPISYVLTESF